MVPPHDRQRTTRAEVRWTSLSHQLTSRRITGECVPPNMAAIISRLSYPGADRNVEGPLVGRSTPCIMSNRMSL